MATYVELDLIDVSLAAALIVVNALISIALQLGMERQLAVASIRTIVQLWLVGLVLEWVFEIDRWYVVLLLLVLMTLVAGVTAARRDERRYPGMLADTVLSVWISSWLVTAFTLFAVVRGTHTWYQPQYSIPLMGMVLGNTLNGVSVGLRTFLDSVEARRDVMDMLLAYGGSRWEACRDTVRNAIRTGMTPIINSMMIVGIVSLPGMMTGQLLSGTRPIEAIKYQIVIMFLIASATALGTTLIALIGYRRLFNQDHQLLVDRLRRN